MQPIHGVPSNLALAEALGEMADCCPIIKDDMIGRKWRVFNLFFLCFRAILGRCFPRWKAVFPRNGKPAV